ncbi:hypothetical protein D3C75_1052260 [compost metagenome]
MPCMKLLDMSSKMTAPAKTRFCFVITLALRAKPIVSATLSILSFISTTSATSSAAPLPPPPIAIPTVAAARAGASFTPSPTITTFPYLSRSSLICFTLSCGSRLLYTRSIPASLAIASAVPLRSPVSITVTIPIS